ncbi:hypothetical protein GLOIN_2v1790075 [Rhizophagus clarus]|uniref:Uncharacterized protein n=1 Tax=Rhizophagus clarus TaxID=94130 RepID=A0A8H3R2N7_9GLOM|nr:hypothetical protein GLOIN_2v1790075 [Rhizophagus clarus]
MLKDTFQPVLTKNQKKKLRKKAKKQQHKQLPIPQISTSKQKQAQTNEEVKHIYIQALLHSFETQVLSILEENFQGVTFQDANEQGKRLIRTFSPDAEPVQYKPLAQTTNISNTLISLIVHTVLRVYSSILTSQDFLAKIFSLLENKVGDTVQHGISRADQNLVDSGILHQDTQQIITKSVPDDQQSLPNLPVDSDAMQIFPDADTVLPSPSLSTTTAKPNKSKKAMPKSIEKVCVNQIIPNDKMNNIRDIFVYNVPAGWSYAKIIAKLKAWGDVISMTTKKRREQFRLYFNDLPQDSNCWQLWDHNKPSNIFSHYPIKALKHFISGGKSQIVMYFEKYQDVEICRKTTFTFNYNGTDYSLPWCASPISSLHKNKLPMKNSNKLNSGSPKICTTNSKPTKNQAKSSKKSQGKKNKKSSGTKSNDKMDIIKLLLALIS